MPLGDPLEFFQSVELGNTHLTRPRRFILLCGGPIDRTTEGAISAREAFLRSLPDRAKFEGHEVILAEYINVFYPESPYRDLIEFEIDFARISDLIIIFSEGFGSLAELGAFSQKQEIAERMLVLMQERHYSVKSFIRDGPIRYLESQRSDSVQVFGWQNDPEDQLCVDRASFEVQVEDIKKGIRDALNSVPRKFRFSKTDFGHFVIVAASIADVLGAALFEEFKNAFHRLGLAVADRDVTRMLFCACSVGWMKNEKRGNQKFYLPTFDAPPSDFAYKDGPRAKDSTRWKRDIRNHWKTEDKPRYRLILDHSRGYGI